MIFFFIVGIKICVGIRQLCFLEKFGFLFGVRLEFCNNYDVFIFFGREWFRNNSKDDDDDDKNIGEYLFCIYYMFGINLSVLRVLIYLIL